MEVNMQLDKETQTNIKALIAIRDDLNTSPAVRIQAIQTMQKRNRTLLRYDFYEQKKKAPDLGISTPEGLEWFTSINGWCTKAVDILADRLQFDEFEDDTFNFTDMFALNNPDIFYDDAILSALINACSFVYVSKGSVINGKT